MLDPASSRAAQGAGTRVPKGVRAPEKGHKTVTTAPTQAAGNGRSLLLDALPGAAARRAGDRVAVRVPGGADLTYAGLDARIDAIAAVLRARLGTGTRRVVAVSSVLGPDFPAVYYAVVRAGHVVAPVNPLLPPPLWQGLLASVGAGAAVLGSDVRARVARALDGVASLRHVLDFEELPPVGGPAPETGPAAVGRQVAEDEVAALMFTSGSTGRPKAVALTHRNLVAGAGQIGSAHGVDADSVVLNGLPIYHPMHLNAAVRAGATQVLAGGPDPVDAVRAGAAAAATHFYALPFQLARLAADPRLDELALPRARLIGTGGLPLPPSAVRRLTERLGVPLVQGYGLTETAGLAHSAGAEGAAAGSVGPALPGARTRVVGLADRKPLGPGQVGAIEVAGPHVAAGYARADAAGALTVAPLVDADGWLATGDAGRLDADGTLFVLDRVCDLYRHGGELVSPGRVERRLGAHPDVRECAVLGVPAEGAADGEALTVAFVVTRPGGLAVGDLVDELDRGRPAAERVHRAEHLDALPRLPNGKVDRAALRTLVPAATP